MGPRIARGRDPARSRHTRTHARDRSRRGYVWTCSRRTAPTPGKRVTKSAPNALDGVVAPGATSPRSTRFHRRKRGEHRELVPFGELQVAFDGLAGNIFDTTPDRHPTCLALFRRRTRRLLFDPGFEETNDAFRAEQRGRKAQHRRGARDVPRRGGIDDDVRDARRMKRRDDVAPRNRHPETRATREGDIAREWAGELHEHAVLTNDEADLQALDGRLRGSRARLHTAAEREFEANGIGQGRVKRRRQAIGGHDVETDRRHQDDLGGPRLRVSREHGLEHGVFAGNVEVVGSLFQTRVDHRATRRRIRTGAVENGCYATNPFRHSFRHVEIERAPRKTERRREGFDRRAVSSRDDRR